MRLAGFILAILLLFVAQGIALAQGRPPAAESGFIPLAPTAPGQAPGQASGSNVAREFQRAPTEQPAQRAPVPLTPQAPLSQQPGPGMPPSPAYAAQPGMQQPAQMQGRPVQPNKVLQDRPDPNVPLDQVQRAWANPVAAPGQVSAGVRRYSFTRDEIENRVLKIAARPYMFTSIQLPACEQIEDFYLGDDYAFEIKKPRDNVIVATAYFAKGDTNMQVIGRSGTRYSFYIYSEIVDAKNVTDTAVYVDVEGLCDARAAHSPRRFNGSAPAREAGWSKGDYLQTMPLNVDQLQFDGYAVFVANERDRIIAPDRVFTDGVWVYLDYGERINSIRLPAAFATVDGVDQPANTRVTGTYGQIYAIQAPNSDITLKNGTAVVCIRLKNPGRSGSAQVDKDLGRAKKGWFR